MKWAVFSSLALTLASSLGLTPVASSFAAVPLELPAVGPEPTLEEQQSVLASLNRAKVPPELQPERAQKILAYLRFLGVTGQADRFKPTLLRLLNSSTQFLDCSDLTDWSCLESPPMITPTIPSRVEMDSRLGQPIRAGKLSMKTYFTHRWNTLDPSTALVPRTMQKALAGWIAKDARRSLSLSIYGIDDIQGSMKEVYSNIVGAQREGVQTRAVFDTTIKVPGMKVDPSTEQSEDEAPTDDRSVTPPLNPPLADYFLLTYANPGMLSDTKAHWILGEIAKPLRVFQYDGTDELARALNEGVQSEDQARARLEAPDTGIMHNKFLVMQNQAAKYSVWTGTTNVSRTCMGDELNANMAIYVKNDLVARSYLAEFNEMFEYREAPIVPDPTSKVRGLTDAGYWVGSFHKNKLPNTPRYFVFDDGSELRVHFAPTDDGEHRSIIPMLLSARTGDEIRVSMFGGSGIEYVRAFQYAAAKGATIKIVFEKSLAGNAASWMKDPVANLTLPNPYVAKGEKPKGSIEVRLKPWKGLNHHKTGTLTRRSKGKRVIYQSLIVGSQNWSMPGNDQNDENMMTLQNKKGSVKAAEDFNQIFDRELWVVAGQAPPIKSK